jgi:hypothetical protein
MLLNDVAKKDLRRCNLAELYNSYLFNKFSIDRETSAPQPIVLRPLSLDESPEYTCGRIFEVMTTVAGKMFRVEGKELRMLPEIGDPQVRSCLTEHAGGELDLPSLLLHAVLVPVGRRHVPGMGGLVHFAFAHKSFQEFFLARYLLSMVRARNDAVLTAGIEVPQAVLRFLRGLFSLLAADEQTEMQVWISESGSNSDILKINS